ncbi:MAG: hypothetical protein LBT33_06270 [Spirochaetia bacterium]|jgi:hypothetical protein|nr:hypothetical protein [Spirochaetia bacterium]
MKKTKTPRILLALACLLAAALPAVSQEGEGVFRGFGVFHDTLWLGNSDTDSAPSPILSVWGAAFKFSLPLESLYFAPEIGFTSVEYFYREDAAFPAEIEYADAVKTIDIILSAPFLYRFVPAPDFVIHAGTGPAFSFKIPIQTYGEGSAGDVGGYFIDKARFVHWEASSDFEWGLFDYLAFFVRARLILPLYRIWDGESKPVYDGLMAGGGFGLRLKF